jgi:hypothetical protein
VRFDPRPVEIWKAWHLPVTDVDLCENSGYHLKIPSLKLSHVDGTLILRQSSYCISPFSHQNHLINCIRIMEDRAKELRMLMKQSKMNSSSSISGNTSTLTPLSSNHKLDNLSGKEKANLLKLLKEKNKQATLSTNSAKIQLELEDRHEKPVKIVSITSLRPSAAAVTKQIAANSSATSSQNAVTVASTKDSSLPTGFFDDYEEDLSSAAIDQEVGNDSESSNNNIVTSIQNQLPASVQISLMNGAGSSSSVKASSAEAVIPMKGDLPDGFFDEDRSNTKAKSASIIDNNTELEAFLQEVKELPVTVEDINDIAAEEIETMEMEEEAVQHAYETRLAAMLHQISKIKDNNENDADDVEEIDEETFQAALLEAKAMIKQTMVEEQQQSIEKSVADAVKVGFRQYQAKLLPRKRAREDSDEADEEESMDDGDEEEEEEAAASFDDYMDNIDWMARSI